MAAPNELIPKFHSLLEPYIKPREQVNYIRRILSLHLGSCTGEDAAAQPLLAVHSSRHVDANAEELRGVRKEYAAALQANIAARRQFDKARQAASLELESRPAAPCDDASFLDGQLALLRLRQRRECLLAVRRSLDRLPALGQGVPDTDLLPSVPKAVVDSFVAEKSAAHPDLGSRVRLLEKAVMRAKLQAKQEDEALAEATARCKGKPQGVSNGARLEALLATRNELISWIESELAKASAEGGDDTAERDTLQAEDSHATVKTLLSQISHKYTSYVAARKEVLALLSQPPSMPPPCQQATLAEPVDSVDPEPADHLLTPYIEALLSVSSHQKNIMSHKSHASSVLKKQLCDSRQALDRLAEESQLLPAYPLRNSQQQRTGLTDDTSKSSNDDGLSSYVRPWIQAADSAKIATLEAVAESIESGQVALESCVESLQNVDRLLGQDTDQGTGNAQPPEGLGLVSREPSAGRLGYGNRPGQRAGDPWSRLLGNLHLVGLDDSK